MPVVWRLMSVALRFAELGSACVVAGIIGSYLDALDKANAWPSKRFIYVEVISGVSILLSLTWLFHFAAGFLHWPTDLVLSAAWFAAFGLLINFLDYNDCGSSTFSWTGITHDVACNRWGTGEAFSFISAVCWLLNAMIGIWFVTRANEDVAVAIGKAGQNLRRWFHQSAA